MANFKRGKCRHNCPRAIRGSMTSWRARHGFRPARVPDDPPDAFANWGDWHRRYDERRRLYWETPGKTHLGMMNSYPAWWDRIFHTRRKRAEVRRLESRVLRGDVDPDDLAWPLASRKPTQYYW